MLGRDGYGWSEVVLGSIGMRIHLSFVYRKNEIDLMNISLALHALAVLLDSRHYYVTTVLLVIANQKGSGNSKIPFD